MGWNLTDGRSVRYEYVLPDGTRADYVLSDRDGRAAAVVEAKRASVNPVEAEGQTRNYAEQLGVPFIFLANGQEVWFWEYGREAHPRKIKTFYSQEDLERRVATLAMRVDPLSISIDARIVDRDCPALGPTVAKKRTQGWSSKARGFPNSVVRRVSGIPAGPRGSLTSPGYPIYIPHTRACVSCYLNNRYAD